MDTKPYDVICFGEVLWDVLPSGAKAGGAPMNVAYHLQKFGLKPALISRVGKDEWGHRLLEILLKNNLPVTYVQQDTLHSTGIVQATIQPNKEVNYDIIHPVAWDFIEMKQVLLSVVTHAAYFICGSLVARDEHSRKTLYELIEAAKIKVVDINLRPPHFSKEVIEHLLLSAHILKLNEHELPLITSFYSNLKRVNDQAVFLQDKFSIPTIIVTMGGHGALVCTEGKITSHKGYKIKVADTVGSGDAFLAAYIYQLTLGAATTKILEFANAAGAFIASKNGACPAYAIEEIYQLIKETAKE